MSFEEILEQALAILQRRGRVSYRALQRQFGLDDAYFEDVKTELLYAYPQVVDDQGRGLVWTGDTASTQAHILPALQDAPQPATSEVSLPQTESPPAAPYIPDAERRQLTVLFCDLVDSTRLAGQLDPEDLREVLRAYQATCAEVIQRLDGHIAQYLGDGLLVYFGYPQAHEDDAQRAVRVGLGIVEAMGALNSRLAQRKGVRLAARVGVHTGLVVVGEVGEGGRQEQLALGETPNIAARLQSFAGPDTVVISGATARLVQGYFTVHDLGVQAFRGVATPLQVYRVLGVSGARSRLDVAGPQGLTPLVGRDVELGLLREHWVQAKAGMGQVILLSGEAGIGKSRLVQALKAHVAGEPHFYYECRCSPYYQHSALYPVIDYFQRLLQLHADATPDARLRRLEDILAPYVASLPEVVPLFASLLSIPLSDRYAPLPLSPERQKQKTLEALLAVLLALAAQQPVLFIMEDLHWIDASTLEWLGLLLQQVPTVRLFVVLIFRPGFQVPWPQCTQLTPLTLSRLTHSQTEAIVEWVAGGKALPAEVLQQVVAKTDGVPLFVEELIKMVLESDLLQEHENRYELTGSLPPLAIPATLHDSLMARLDRLSTVREVAQLSATLGRAFPYALLRAISPLDEEVLQQALVRLVEAEILYQRGLPPQTTYIFKHALIQDAAYQSLLKSRRQQVHQRIAEVLVEQFPEIAATQPELLAHHYTEAGLLESAIVYWQQAGRRAIEGSAHVEALGHLSQGMTLLQTLPSTPARTQHALTLQLTLAATLMKTRGYGALEVEHAYARARELCRQVGESPQMVRVLFGLWAFYMVRAQFHAARELGEQLLQLAEHQRDPALLMIAHHVAGTTLLFLGEFTPAREHFAHSIALDDSQAHRTLLLSATTVPRVANLFYTGVALWFLGYPDQALSHTQEALSRAQELSHPFSLTAARVFAAIVRQLRREEGAVQEQSEAAMALAVEQEFTFWSAQGTILRGWALAEQGYEAGIAQMEQGLATHRTMGAELVQPYYLAMLAETYGKTGQIEAGVRVVAEALTKTDTHGERWWEAELYRLQGEFLLRVTCGIQHATEAEACFRQALDIAHRQHAKSWELRAAMSLSRLWQRQGKHDDARQLLTEIYSWFTEGFDTADLQEARALLEVLW